MKGGIRRAIGGLCVLAGATLLAAAGSAALRGWLWQERHAGSFRGAGPQAPPGSEDRARGQHEEAAPRRGGPPVRGEALARLRLPRLRLETIVVEGSGPDSLSLGPGHLEGSALPGDSDNCVIAGHRDGPFGRLRSVRPGDLVEITDRRGTHRYRVESARVVGEEETGLLAPSRASVLTLVTCYPFDHVGRARQRFVVRASPAAGAS